MIIVGGGINVAVSIMKKWSSTSQFHTQYMDSSRLIKYCILFFLASLLLAPKLYEQGKENTYFLLDNNSKDQIQNAHIRDSKNRIIAITNDLGEFNLKTDIGNRNDSLKISCIGYKTLALPLDFLSKQNYILLETDTLILDEVTVRSITPLEIIKKTISAIPRNYLKNKIVLQGNFNLNIEKDTSHLRKSQSNILVNMLSHNYSPTIENLVYTSQLGDSELMEEDTALIRESFLFDHIIHGRGFLNIANIDSWKFRIEEFTLYEGKEVVVISATFISTNLVTVLSPKANSTSHKAKMYINLEDFAILKISYDYKWNKRDLKKSKVDSLWVNNISWSGFAYYTKRNNKYLLLNLGNIQKKEIYKQIYRQTGFTYKKRHDYEISSDFVTN